AVAVGAAVAAAPARAVPVAAAVAVGVARAAHAVRAVPLAAVAVGAAVAAAAARAVPVAVAVAVGAAVAAFAARAAPVAGAVRIRPAARPRERAPAGDAEQERQYDPDEGVGPGHVRHHSSGRGAVATRDAVGRRAATACRPRWAVHSSTDECFRGAWKSARACSRSALVSVCARAR